MWFDKAFLTGGAPFGAAFFADFVAPSRVLPFPAASKFSLAPLRPDAPLAAGVFATAAPRVVVRPGLAAAPPLRAATRGGLAGAAGPPLLDRSGHVGAYLPGSESC